MVGFLKFIDLANSLLVFDCLLNGIPPSNYGLELSSVPAAAGSAGGLYLF